MGRGLEERFGCTLDGWDIVRPCQNEGEAGGLGDPLKGDEEPSDIVRGYLVDSRASSNDCSRDCRNNGS